MDSPKRAVDTKMANPFLQQDIPVLMVTRNIKNSTYLPQQNQNLNQTTNFYNLSQRNQIKLCQPIFMIFPNTKRTSR